MKTEFVQPDPTTDSSSSSSYHSKKEGEEDQLDDDYFNPNESKELFNKLSRRLKHNDTICLPCSMRFEL